MKTFLLLLLVGVNTFLYSQKIIPVKVTGYEKSNFKELKWFALVNYGDKVFSRKKPKIGKTLFYVDTVHGDVYNVWEYETSLFDSLFNINYTYHGDTDIMVTNVVRNKNTSNYKWTIFTNQNITYQSNYKHKKNDIVFSVDDITKTPYWN